MNPRDLPDWPYRMKAALAAAFCDVSVGKFRAGVRAGRYPAGVRDGGNVFWYRHDLERALDLIRQNGATSAPDDPYLQGVVRHGRRARPAHTDNPPQDPTRH